MNFIDMRIFFNTAYSVSNINWLFSDCTFLSEIQIENGLHLGSDHLDSVNFIKTIFQILRNDVIDKVQFSNCVCKYQMFSHKKQDKSIF